jgi:hypothetical protein
MASTDGPTPLQNKQKSSLRGVRFKIDGALVAQESQIAENVGFDAIWLGFCVDLLQLRNDLVHGVFSVATLDDFEAGAVEAKRALRHKQDALLIVFAKPATWREARAGILIDGHLNSNGFGHVNIR